MKTKYEKYLKYYFYIVFLFSLGNYFVVGISIRIMDFFGGDLSKIIELPIFLLGLILISIKSNLKYKNVIFHFGFLVLIYIILSAIAVLSFNFVFAFRLFFWTTLGLFLAFELKLKIFEYITKLTFWFAVISTILFVFAYFLPSINTFITSVGISTDNENYSILFYNIKTRVLDRNSGFAYEPGPFGLICALAMVIDLTKNSYKFNKKYIVYILAIYTSQSSTAGVFLLISIIFFYYNSFKGYRIIIMPIVLIIAYFFYQSQEFLEEKISNDWEESQNTEEIIKNGKNNEQVNGTYRFAILFLTWPDVKSRPLFGFNHNPSLNYRSTNNIYIRGTGPLGFVAIYGTILTILLIVQMKRSIKMLNVVFKNNFGTLIGIWWFFILFSFTTIVQSLFFTSILFIYLPLKFSGQINVINPNSKFKELITSKTLK